MYVYIHIYISICVQYSRLSFSIMMIKIDSQYIMIQESVHQ